jgi:hypothetical protein
VGGAYLAHLATPLSCRTADPFKESIRVGDGCSSMTSRVELITAKSRVHFIEMSAGHNT